MLDNQQILTYWGNTHINEEQLLPWLIIFNGDLMVRMTWSAWSTVVGCVRSKSILVDCPIPTLLIFISPALYSIISSTFYVLFIYLFDHGKKRLLVSCHFLTIIYIHCVFSVK